MISLTKLLFEGVISPVLYHVTDIGRTISILEENKFRLSPAYGTDSDLKHQKGKLYYLSASRVKYGGYSRTQGDVGSVTIELNGRKLGDNYTSVNVDYWGSETRQAQLDAGRIEDFMKYDENEERIVTNDPEIEPASKYIKSLHVSIGDPSVDEPSKRKEKTKKRLKYLEDLAEKLSIPIYFYTDPQNWKRQRKDEAYQSLSELFSDFEEIGDYQKETPPVYSEGRYLSGVVEILQKEKFKNLSEEGQEVYNKLNRTGIPMDFKKVLKNDIHNNKSNSKVLDKIKVISRHMKRAGKNTIEGLIEILKDEVKDMERENKEELYNKYKSTVEAILNVYKLRNQSNIDAYDLNRYEGAGIDGLTKFFDYIGRESKSMEDFDKNQAVERAFRAVNEIAKLMKLGYFGKLKSIVKDETEEDVLERRFRKFMDNIIQPILYRIAYNEGWIDYYEFNK